MTRVQEQDAITKEGEVEDEDGAECKYGSRDHLGVLNEDKDSPEEEDAIEDEDEVEDKSVQKRAGRGWPGVYWPAQVN